MILIPILLMPPPYGVYPAPGLDPVRVEQREEQRVAQHGGLWGRRLHGVEKRLHHISTRHVDRLTTRGLDHDGLLDDHRPLVGLGELQEVF